MKRRKKCKSKRKYDWKLFFCAAVMLVAGLYFTVFSIQCAVMLNKIDNNELLEYQGGFHLTVKKYARNVKYEIELENGVEFSIPAEYIQDNVYIKDAKELEFRYLNNKDLLDVFNDSSNCVSIKSVEGDITLLGAEDTKSTFRLGAIGFPFLGIPSILLSGFIMWLTLKTTK